MTEQGKSPGYWGHQFKAYYDGKRSPHECWTDLIAWTEAIDEYYGVPPPAFDGYPCRPVSAMDTNGDGVFNTDDAHTIFANKKDWKAVWIGYANWYNSVADCGPYWN